jgi:hypothetical protein
LTWIKDRAQRRFIPRTDRPLPDRAVPQSKAVAVARCPLFVVRPATATATSRNIHSTVVLFRRQLFGFFLPSRELLASCWRQLLRCPLTAPKLCDPSKHSPRLYSGWSEAKSEAWTPGTWHRIAASSLAPSASAISSIPSVSVSLPRCRTLSRGGPSPPGDGDDKRRGAVPADPKHRCVARWSAPRRGHCLPEVHNSTKGTHASCITSSCLFRSQAFARE